MLTAYEVIETSSVAEPLLETHVPSQKNSLFLSDATCIPRETRCDFCMARKPARTPEKADEVLHLQT